MFRQEIDSVEYNQLLSHFGANEAYLHLCEKYGVKDFDHWLVSPETWDITSDNNKDGYEILIIKNMIEYIIQHELKNLLHYFISIDHPALYFAEALHLAAKHNKPDMMDLMISAGFDVNMPTTQLHHENNHEYGVTPLHMAASQGNLEAVQYLLAHGANPNTYVITDMGSRTRLDLKTNAHFVPYYKDTTPLHAAIYAALVNKFNLNVIEALLESGADTNLTAGTNQEPSIHLAISVLSSAVKFRHSTGPLPVAELVKLLLSHGADIGLKSRSGGDAFAYLHAHLTGEQHFAVLMLLLHHRLRSDAPIPNEILTVSTPVFSSPFTFISQWQQTRVAKEALSLQSTSSASTLQPRLGNPSQ
jgi:ankyrin repeat protein